jgi:hypothetical protein
MRLRSAPADGPTEARRAPATARPTVVRELGMMFAAVIAYFAIRGLVESGSRDAFANAWRVIDFERDLGIFWEEQLQRPFLEYGVLTTLMNWVYIYGHWPFIIVVAVWLVFWHPAEYRVIRNAFLISGSVGLVIFLFFPVAPPRLIEGIGVVDTVTEHSRAYRILQPPALVNQYAAIPSFHFGWNMLIGLGIFRCARSAPVRAIGILSPVAMFISTIATANHYIVDPIIGGAMALAALYFAEWLRGRKLSPFSRELWFSAMPLPPPGPAPDAS